MGIGANHEVLIEIDRLFRSESRWALAALMRILGDFHLAEEALQEAFAIAAEKWPIQGIPSNPRNWLISTARFKAIDRIRRDSRITQNIDDDALQTTSDSLQKRDLDEEIEDDLLRLIFLCCHPTIALEAQVALTLREVCGLRTDEIARAFLVSDSTMAQRITRAKAKLRESGASFEPLTQEDRLLRLEGVLKVIYLVFNEGYYSSFGPDLTSVELSKEALRLGSLLAQLFPHPEVFGLNALMCFSESRREAREQEGEIILLEDQDRSRWNQDLIKFGIQNLAQSENLGIPGPYALQAKIAEVHASSVDFAATNWHAIADLYTQLDSLTPSPVIKLNRAVAWAMTGKVEEALIEINGLIESGDLASYCLAHAAKADMLRRLGRFAEAKSAYLYALNLSKMDPERKFLKMRVSEMDSLMNQNSKNLTEFSPSLSKIRTPNRPNLTGSKQPKFRHT